MKTVGDFSRNSARSDAISVRMGSDMWPIFPVEMLGIDMIKKVPITADPFYWYELRGDEKFFIIPGKPDTSSLNHPRQFMSLRLRNTCSGDVVNCSDV
jgi:hypothetical protein